MKVQSSQLHFISSSFFFHIPSVVESTKVYFSSFNFIFTHKNLNLGIICSLILL